MFAQAVFTKQAIQNYLAETITDYTAVYSVGADLENKTPAEKQKAIAAQ
jgi:hypothetical protein